MTCSALLLRAPANRESPSSSAFATAPAGVLLTRAVSFWQTPRCRKDIEERVQSMVELIRSNDLVYISWIEAMLAAESIECVVLDGFTSVIEGSIGAIPRRVMVLEEDAQRARELVKASGAVPAT
jgi:hypothetical protein